MTWKPRRAGSGPAGVLILLCAAIATGAAARDGAARAPRPADEKRFVFAGIPWYAPADSVRTGLAARGYRLVPETRDAIVAQGRTFDHVSVVRGALDDSLRVVRWEVKLVHPGREDLFGEPDPDAAFPEMKRVYDQIVTECQERYGRPWDAVEHYAFPYERDDGRGASALHDRKAEIRTVWRGGHSGDRLVVEMDGDVNVVLTYSCPGWNAWQERQRHRKGRDL